MRVLHTADWHLGHVLNGWSREAEHEVWINSLVDITASLEIDVMLVSGDVYDGINPSGESQRLLYQAIRRLKQARPSLRIVITSGNHDPAGRLEAPSPVLESLDCHVVASMRRHGDEMDMGRHMIPLPDADGITFAYACAIPFLRSADLPGLSFSPDEGRGSPIVRCASRLLSGIGVRAREIAGDLPILAMAHLHCHGASESEGAERRILIGGEHALPEDVFPEEFDYVALGHLHRPQTRGNGRLRYSGSCFPLSATEIDYVHGVTILDITDEGIDHDHVEIPRPAEVLRIPERGAMSLEAFELALAEIEVEDEIPHGLCPLVYVRLEATGPASVLMAEVERLLAGTRLRTAGITVRRATDGDMPEPPVSLVETSPEDLFHLAFVKVNGTRPEDRHIAFYREAVSGV